MSQSKINIGILGAGNIATKHLDALSSLGELFTISGLYDVNRENASAKSKMYSTHIFNNANECILESDIVTICTPSGLHKEHALQCLREKKHIIIEKPMAISVNDCSEIIEEAKKQKCFAFTMYQLRMIPLITRIKDIITNGAIGKIYIAQANIFWNRSESYFNAAKWRGTKNMDGGALLNQGIHHIDLLRWLAGDVHSVYAKTSNFRHHLEIEDSAIVNINFNSGAIGAVNFTTAAYAKTIENSICIIGEKGNIKVSGPGLNKIEYLDIEGFSPDDIQPTTIDSNSNLDNHSRYYLHIYDVIKNNVKPIISAEDGLASVNIIQLAYESSQKGQNIMVTPA